MTLALLRYNNYYNRIVKKRDTIAEHEDNGEVITTLIGINFIPNDGISTEQIINYDGEIPDYLIVSENGYIINSRWFVTEAVRTRMGQYHLSLLRDVLADWYEEVMRAPVFIKKGYPLSINDPAIFNNETMTFNQIKQREYWIRDKSWSGWYVGYLSKTAKGEQTRINVPSDSVAVSEVYGSIEDYPYSQYTAANPFIGDFTSTCFNMYGYYGSAEQYCAGFDAYGNRKTPNVEDNLETDDDLPTGVVYDDFVMKVRGFDLGDDDSNPFLDGRFWTEVGRIKTWREEGYNLVGAHNQAATDDFINSQRRRVIQVGNSIKTIEIKSTFVSKTVDAENTSSFARTFYTVAQNLGLSVSSGVYNQVSSLTFTATGYYLDFVDLPEASPGLTYQIPDNRTQTAGVPYDIFAIPADSIQTFSEPYINQNSSSRLAQRLIAAITSQLVDGQVLYDLQYVPYCPLDDQYLWNGTIMTSRLNTGSTIDYSYITPDPEKPEEWTVIFYASEHSFHKNIQTPIFTLPETVEGFKVENECDMYRLCSPNYNGQFEFSVTKNGGVNGWNVTFTYKPFSPYIKVAPEFGRLYGRNFDDARGLICGGDFSISQVESEWKKYELNNKNYQVMFDRQIQNMEVNNSIQREIEKWNAIAGTAQGAVTGAMAGQMMGGGGKGGAIAMGIGAALGGAASYKAGVIDRQLNERLRAEALDYAKDMYGYQLQNIRAIPYSLTKVGSQNLDYKVWPFVERYSCTDVEKQALRDKLKWNGYTIERVGIIPNFLKPDGETFIQGKLIRLDTINEDSHIVDVINAELQTGVYIK